MNKKSKSIRLILACLFIASVSCSGSNSNLEVTLVPTTTPLIPAGTVTLNGGAFSITGPYFTMSSINLLWKGTGTLEILAIVITMTLPATSNSTTGSTGTSTGSGSSTAPGGTSGTSSIATCSFGGDDIKTLFPNNVNASRVVVLTQGEVVQKSGPFGCGAISAPVPIPSGYTISATMQVIGAAVDGSGNTTGRVIGTANITVE